MMDASIDIAKILNFKEEENIYTKKPKSNQKTISKEISTQVPAQSELNKTEESLEDKPISEKSDAKSDTSEVSESKSIQKENITFEDIKNSWGENFLLST